MKFTLPWETKGPVGVGWAEEVDEDEDEADVLLVLMDCTVDVVVWLVVEDRTELEVL